MSSKRRPPRAAQDDAGLEAALDSNRLGPADDGARARAILETALERCRTRLPRRPLPAGPEAIESLTGADPAPVPEPQAPAACKARPYRLYYGV